MSRNHGIRQIHRWTSIVITAAVVVTSVALARSSPAWVGYLPLPPLFLMLVTGLYLFALPYVRRGRGRAATA